MTSARQRADRKLAQRPQALEGRPGLERPTLRGAPARKAQRPLRPPGRPQVPPGPICKAARPTVGGSEIVCGTGASPGAFLPAWPGYTNPGGGL